VTGGLFNGDIGLGVVIVLAVVAIVAMVLLARAIRRDSNVRLTRIGWFVERERYETDGEDAWPELLQPPGERTLPQWPDKDTEVKPPPTKEDQ
jgi:hypothetical protein